MNNLKVRDIKNSQFFKGLDSNTQKLWIFRAWGDSILLEGKWTVEATDSGDYCYTFTEDDEHLLYPAEFYNGNEEE